MKPIFSIIVPTYNSENYINKCIDSIQSQKISKKEYEIIIVDDFSKDRTLKICKKLKKKNNYIKIIHNKINMGVSYSRNIGIKKSGGKYIIFLDSDDELKKNSLNYIKRILKRNDVDLLLALNLEKKIKSKFIKIFLEKNRNLIKIEPNILFKLLNKQPNFKAHCWNYILNRNFIKKNKIYFKNFRVYEDQIFISKVLLTAKKIKFYKTSFHKHNERFSSLGRSMNYSTLQSAFKIINHFNEMIEAKNLTYEQNKFLKFRINFMLKLFKIHLLTCKKLEIKRFNLFVQKYSKTFTNNKLKFIEKINYNFIDKNISLLLSKFNFKKYSFIYIFGIGKLGRATHQILKRNYVKISAFLDYNKKFHNKKYLSLKILNPNILKKINKNNLKKTLIISSFEDSKINNKLKAYSLNNINLKTLSWKRYYKLN